MNDPFGRSMLVPADFDRPHRVLLVGEAFGAWLAGRQPSEAAKLFVAGGAMAWLSEGGDLLGDFWKVRGRQGSTATAPVIWSALREERQDTDEGQH